jgi:hypothetical protein
VGYITDAKDPPFLYAQSFDDLVGVDIYVNPLTAAYDRLTKINEEHTKAGKPPLSVMAADKNLLEDDLVEMVNGGLIAATSAMQHRAALWAQVLPNIKLHPQMMVSSDGELAWVDLPRFLCPPPNPSECYRLLVACGQAQGGVALVAFCIGSSAHRIPCNLLILRTTNLRDQEFDGSNTFAPTAQSCPSMVYATFSFSFVFSGFRLKR